MQKITLFGEELTIAFNYAVRIMFEKITDKSFDSCDFNRSEDRIALYISSILANNKDCTITDEKLMYDATLEDIQKLDVAVSQAISEWYHVPTPAGEDQDEQDEDKEKN